MCIAVLKILEIPQIHNLQCHSLSRMFFLTIDFLLFISTFIFVWYPKGENVTRSNLTSDSVVAQWSMNLMVGCGWVKTIELFKYGKQTRTTSQYFYNIAFRLIPYIGILIVVIVGFTLVEFICTPSTIREGDKYNHFWT